MTVCAAVVVGLLATSLAAAVISGRDLFYSLAVTWGGLLVVSCLWSRSALAGVRLRRWAPALRSQLGVAFEEIPSLSNSSWLPEAWLEVDDMSELPGHRVSSVTVALGGRQERSWIVRTLRTQRGEFRLGPAVLRAEGWMRLEQVFRIELPQMRRSANLILITPSVDPGIAGRMLDLARHGLLPMAVLLDAKSFAGSPGSRGLAAAIRRVGFDVRLLTCGQDIGRALSVPPPRGLRTAG